MDNNSKIIYSEILAGYSPLLYKDVAIFIKHLSNLDLSLIDIYREEQYQYALLKGAVSLKDRLDTIIQEKNWSLEKDKELDGIRDFIINLKHSRTKHVLEKNKKLIDKEIALHNEKYLTLTIEKNKLIGKTAEQFADKKVNEYYMYISLFKDSEFKNKLFTKEEFDELDEFTLMELLITYNKRMELFNGASFKKIALFPMFANLFDLCDDNAFQFYGKPIIYLTFYQIEIFQWGKQFKNIMNNSKIRPPVEILDNPDKLLEWFENVNVADGIINNPNITQETSDKETVLGGSSMVGATNEDYKKYGLQGSENAEMTKKLKEKGELTVFDLMNM